jgi:DNA mismatch endonuclease (patch repair protein)
VALTVGDRMARVRVKNTEPELEIRKILYAKGVRYRIHRQDLPGKPDIYIPRLRVAIFVNGCFWHGHEGCSRAALPKTNASFWKSKIQGNALRDQRICTELRLLGIEPVLIWTCDAKNFVRICAMLAKQWARSAPGQRDQLF